MQIINSSGVYAYALNELEWYGVNEAGRQSTIDNCLEGAKLAGCQYANIMVEPDAIMSISPEPKRHQVWRHTFPTSDEKAFENALLDAYVNSKLNELQKTAIARKVFEL